MNTVTRCTHMHIVHNVIHNVTSCEDKTNTCCELLTWSVTGAEPDQVFLCQTAVDLIRIQGAGHPCVSTTTEA